MIELSGKYTSAKIFAETIEEGVYAQVYDIINCRAFEGQKVVCMPDVHVGASGPCGLVKELILETCEIKFMMIPKINIKAADGGD